MQLTSTESPLYVSTKSWGLVETFSVFSIDFFLHRKSHIDTTIEDVFIVNNLSETIFIPVSLHTFF